MKHWALFPSDACTTTDRPCIQQVYNLQSQQHSAQATCMQPLREQLLLLPPSAHITPAAEAPSLGPTHPTHHICHPQPQQVLHSSVMGACSLGAMHTPSWSPLAPAMHSIPCGAMPTGSNLPSLPACQPVTQPASLPGPSTLHTCTACAVQSTHAAWSHIHGCCSRGRPSDSNGMMCVMPCTACTHPASSNWQRPGASCNTHPQSTSCQPAATG